MKEIAGQKRGKKLNSVHEERGDEDRRRASGQTRGGGEVAGLEDVGDCCAATLTPSVPGAAGIRSNRRTRPLSLAVQPLNYRRFDPDPKIAINIVTSHHPNMTSQESIGSCSLDVDQSASDRSGWLSSMSSVFSFQGTGRGGYFNAALVLFSPISRTIFLLLVAYSGASGKDRGRIKVGKEVNERACC